jgi:molybdopterin-containing oxidoreductase family iron-sulfur binding subunit
MHDSERTNGGDASGTAPVTWRPAGAARSAMWRSVDERTGTPVAAAEPAPAPDGFSRRNFLQLMGASAALAGVAGCARQPLEKIVPYVRQPEDLVPGKPLFFATALTLGGVARPVLAESHNGRPTKLEGNPEHPSSRGATDRWAQADILRLYDPDRSQTVLHLDQVTTWTAATAALRVALGEQQARRGAGVRILTETVTSPTLVAAIDEFLRQYPQARWVQYEPDGGDLRREGTTRAFGAPHATRWDFAQADVVVSLDADFLTSGVGCVRHARDFASRRRVEAAHGGGAAASHGSPATMNRLYAVETMPGGCGTVADHRLALAPTEVARFAVALAAELSVPGTTAPAAPLDPKAARFAAAAARDLAAHRGRAVVVPGDATSADVHVLVHGINVALDAVGRAVTYSDPIESRPTNQMHDLAALAGEMHAGGVDLLLVLGGNPVYDAPADLRFADAMAKVAVRFHLGLYADETAELCHWHVPAAHELEAWGDARADDGSAIVQQPLIAPLYEGRTAVDVVAVLAGTAAKSTQEQVRDRWRAAGVDTDRAWRRALHDGFVAGSAPAARAVALDSGAVRAAATALSALPPAGGLELALRIDPTVHDGRFANNGWLQELPKPWTKLTWDNAAIVSPATAAALGVRNGDVVSLQTAAGQVEAGVWVLPGHAERCVTAHLGYGRRRGGRVASGAGFDAYVLRSSRQPWSAPVEVRPTGRTMTLVTTQEHGDMERRNLVRHATLSAFLADPHGVHAGAHVPSPDLSLYPAWEYNGYKWGLAVDLGTCTGCNACVTACNSENNIPVVGKDQVRRNREMHWIRIDRYFEGDLDDPQVHHQPVMCMQCENAPCEVVCPVGATSHSPEGLNDMAYNRCVGTRYCSNNCPYKVRRFNFYMFSDLKTPSLKLMRNPDVTIRTRGVMEKCTYCVQRINQARIQSKNEGRTLRDGEILTACQQVCPSEAIVFGDLNDPESRVAKLRADARNYGLLEDLQTRPRTTYLARIRNPNPELEAQA